MVGVVRQEANRRAVEAAANGLGPSVDAICRRLRVAVQEEFTVGCAIAGQNPENGGLVRVMGGVLNTTRESPEDFSTGTR